MITQIHLNINNHTGTHCNRTKLKKSNRNEKSFHLFPLKFVCALVEIVWVCPNKNEETHHRR